MKEPLPTYHYFKPLNPLPPFGVNGFPFPRTMHINIYVNSFEPMGPQLVVRNIVEKYSPFLEHL